MKILFLIGLALVGCSPPAERVHTLRSDAKQAAESDGLDSEREKPVIPEDKDPDRVPQVPEDVKEVDPEPTIPDEPVDPISCTKSTVVSKSYKVCETSVAGIQVKYFPLADSVQASRIALYLHGDTAGDWKDPFVAVQLASWAAKNKVLIVMPLSTAKYDDDPVGVQSYGAAQPADAEKLVPLVDNFVRFFKTPRDNLLYAGVSGGPWFMTSSYIPIVAGRFPGLFALSCGASLNFNKAKWDYTDSTIRNKVKILFNYGDKDFLRTGEEKSFDYYQKAGFEVSKIVHPGANHCDHDIQKATIEFWEKHM